jgi:isoquinoline 1-oxidoreductase alpha subunit
MTTLTVNGKKYSVNAPAGTPLLWIIRDYLGLTGTKYGCGIEECGACTIHIEGEAERSCTATLGDAVGNSVTTIEGLSPDSTHPVQLAWISEQAPQCGYCQSGMIMAAAALLKRYPKPTDAQIDAAMTNLCVCGTYQRVRNAIHVAAGN